MGALFCFGLGYCAEHYVAAFGHRFARISGTVHTAEKAAAIASQNFGGRKVEARVFDGVTAMPDVDAAVDGAEAILISIAPDERGDPVLAHFSDSIGRRPPQLTSIVYLSTIGVYGGHDGRWIDETTAATPVNARSRERLFAEDGWRRFGAHTGRPVAILRLAGIYGPGQSPLTQLENGTAKRIVKPGQVFNRIHVGDIAQAIDAAFQKRADGVFNVSDDEPAPASDVVAFAASLLGVSPPPEIAYAEAEATMTPLAKSFYGEVKRVRNAKLKMELGVTLRYPTYREGLRAIRAKDTPKAV